MCGVCVCVCVNFKPPMYPETTDNPAPLKRTSILLYIEGVLYVECVLYGLHTTCTAGASTSSQWGEIELIQLKTCQSFTHKQSRRAGPCGEGFVGSGSLGCEPCSPGKFMSYQAGVTCSGTCPCGSHSTSSGSFSDGPGNYRDSQICSWLVTPGASWAFKRTPATNITIAFSSFDTERGRDFVTINECTSWTLYTTAEGEFSRVQCNTRRQLAILSGSDVSANTSYTVSTGLLEVEFSSDGAKTRAGFEANYSIKTTTMTECYECNPGTYANVSGSSSCTWCPYGSYQNKTGATGCVTCDCGEEKVYHARGDDDGDDDYAVLVCAKYCLEKRKEEEEMKREKEELEKAKAKEISIADLVFVGVGISCELYTAFSICTWNQEYLCSAFMLFLADVGFSVGKLFPGPAYNCDSWSCRKVTHVCTLTMCASLFQIAEMFLVRTMTRDQGTTVPALVKILEYSAGLAFVVYGAATLDRPGVGTTVLVVFASLAEILLLASKVHTFWTYMRPESAVGPLLRQVQIGECDDVQRLLQNNADVNAANSCTPSPLGLQPARADRRECAYVLTLDAGATQSGSGRCSSRPRAGARTW